MTRLEDVDGIADPGKCTGMDTDQNTQVVASQADEQVDQVDQINVLLDTIRVNLSNIERTWGKDSRQYRSAAEVMQVCLLENVERVRQTQRQKQSGRVSVGDVQMREDVGDEGGLGADVDVKVEAAIEALMAELRIGSAAGERR